MRRRHPKLSTRILRTGLLSVTAGAFACAAIFAGAYLAFPLEGTTVSGNDAVPDSAITNLVANRTSLLTINTSALREEILSDPRVKGATVKREWDNREVVVNVEERTPILRAEINGRSMVLASDGTELPGNEGAGLPVVEMEAWQVAEVLSVARVLQEGGGNLDSIDSVGAEGIRTTIGGRSVLVSGTLEAAQVESLPDVFRENPEASGYDLRSPGRVIVSGDEGSRDTPENPAG